MSAHRKPHLPEKICKACGRPFAWRKKWARDWAAVLYCSQRCKGERNRSACNGSDIRHDRP
ncbi:DUF2256 domain-containing protein [Roseibium sp.]|uniref:DUF2256 domain-containing protein n=1 Tax=Roseibium sp. TaxID=1936156 RepID=UPI003A97D0C5